MRQFVRSAFLASTLLLACFWLSAQTTNVVQGTVKDGKGEPVIGAAVGIRGTSIGTVTDGDGKFSLSVPASATTLEVKYIGFKTSTVEIAKGNFNVVLNEDITGLDEVVVTAQAVKREKRSLGYSTTTVGNEELNESAPISALDALQGKVAGAQITNETGTPGGSTRVVLRGGSSLTGDNNALIVVDGVPIDNSNFGFADILNNDYDAGNRANDINPEDIESVTVLKGAAAVALYGQRGANGAILYTTKSGRELNKGGGTGKKFKVSVSENIAAETPLKLPTMQNQFGQGSEDNFGNGFFQPYQNWSWGPQFNGAVTPWGTPVLQPNGTEQIQVKPYSAIPNNLQSFFNVGATYNTNVAIEGVDKGTSYYLSFNDTKYDGIIPTTGYMRNSIKANISHDFGDKITVTTNFTYTNTHSDLAVNSQGNQGIYNLLLNTPRDISFKELQNLNNPFNQPQQNYDPYYPNPYWILSQEKTTDNVDRFVANINAEYKPTNWLNIVERFGADIYTDQRQQDFNSYSFYPIYFYPQGSFTSPVPTQYIGKFDQDNYVVNNYNSDLMATFHKDFKKDVTFSLLLGNNIYSNLLRNTYGETNGLTIPNVYNFSNSAERPTLTNQIFENRLIGAYADLNIGWRNMLFFELTGRNDWSSTLPLNNRSYFYPGGSISWVFSETGKKKLNPMGLSYGKIRASIAQIGRDAPPYSLTNFFVPGDISDLYVNTDIKSPYYSPANSNIPGYALGTTLENSTLKPEISSTGEVGAELGFLKDRLTIDATYYYKYTKNEILTIPIAPSSGYNNEVINAGVLQNQGVELAVHGTPISTASGFKWEIYGTFTKNYSKVLQVANNTDQIVLGGSSGIPSAVDIVVQKGQPLGSFYGVPELTNSKGQVVVDSSNGLPLAATKPAILGSYQPNWLGSIGTSFSYKGLRIAILFDGRDGGQFYSQTAGLQYFLGNDIATAYNNRVPFVVPNSVYLNSEGQYATNTTKTGAYNYWYTVSENMASFEMVTATFVKLREVSITYSLPAKVLAKTKSITGVSIKAFASNVWIWTPKSNTFADPEVSTNGSASPVQGYEFYNLPSLRNFGGGFTVDF
jgi:TonB-linked SusC/RagA family outer membrane protein